MTAVLFPGDSSIELITVDRPDPAPDEVVIVLTASGVCGTDVHYWQETPQQRGDRRSVVPGHEVVGIIDRAGSGVRGLSAGDRVVVGLLHIGCGRCHDCAAGRHMYCPDKVIMGRNLHGSYGSVVTVPARAVYRLPDGLRDDVAVLAACNLSTAYAAFHKTELRAGQRLIVFGLGGVGLSALLVAVHAGVEVIGVEPIPERRTTALELGASAVHSPEEFTAALGADHRTVLADAVIECSGHPWAQQTTVEPLRPGGRVILVAGGSRLDLPLARIIGWEISIRGTSVCGADLFHDVLGFADRHQDELARLLGPRFTIDQAPDALSHAARGAAGKALFRW